MWTLGIFFIVCVCVWVRERESFFVFLASACVLIGVVVAAADLYRFVLMFTSYRV